MYNEFEPCAPLWTMGGSDNGNDSSRGGCDGGRDFREGFIQVGQRMLRRALGYARRGSRNGIVCES